MKFKLKIEMAYHLVAVGTAMRFISKFQKKHDVVHSIDPCKKDEILLEKFNQLSVDDRIRFIKAGCLLKDVMWPLMTSDVCVEAESP